MMTLLSGVLVMAMLLAPVVVVVAIFFKLHQWRDAHHHHHDHHDHHDHHHHHHH